MYEIKWLGIRVRNDIFQKKITINKSNTNQVDEVSEEDWSLSPANQRTRAQREAALEEAARMRPSLSSNDESLSRRSSESSESAPSELAPMSMASSTERRLGR